MSDSTCPRTTLKTPDPLQKIGYEPPGYHFSQDDHALIIGAGLAGCAVARALAANGVRCTIFDSLANLASGASSVPIAIFKPHASNSQSLQAEFVNRCFEKLSIELDTIGIEPTVSGLHQVVKETSGYQRSAYWRPAGTNALQSYKTIFSDSAGALTPSTLCRHWVQRPQISCVFNTSIAYVNHCNGSWSIRDANKNEVGKGQILILANAMSAAGFTSQPALVPVSGQISLFQGCNPGPVICNDGYLIPTTKGVWSGATFHRGIHNAVVSTADDEQNFERCRSILKNGKHSTPLQSWSGVRCTTADRLPVIGAVPDTRHYQNYYHDLHHGRINKIYPPAEYKKGLYILTGLGSRGVTQALYSGEVLADIILGTSSTDSATLRALHPARFLIRHLKKASNVNSLT